MYDAIVVGARCAGSPTAMLLARQGHRVLLVDRATFPSDTISTHFIQVPGMVRLHRWGLLDAVLATGCPPVTEGRLDIDGDAVGAEFEAPAGIPGLLAPRRTLLDKILVDAAVEAGAELREGVMIDRLLVEDGRVVGVEGHTSEGSFVERARIVIGADGRNSAVGRAVGAEMYFHEPALGGGYYSYWSGVDCPKAEMYLYKESFTVAFPTNDGLTTIALAVRPERFVEMRKDDENSILELFDGLGDLGERVRAGKRAHDLIPVANLANFLRQPGGPGWALVGDAAYHKDPSPADGITDAFRGADLLAESLEEMFAGRMTEEEALARYKERQDSYALALVQKTVEMSTLGNTPLEKATALLEIQALHQAEVADIQNGSAVPA